MEYNIDTDEIKKLDTTTAIPTNIEAFNIWKKDHASLFDTIMIVYYSEYETKNKNKIIWIQEDNGFQILSLEEVLNLEESDSMEDEFIRQLIMQHANANDDKFKICINIPAYKDNMSYFNIIPLSEKLVQYYTNYLKQQQPVKK